jgi:predicted dehydrogenase
MSKTYKAIIVGAGAIGHAHMEGYNLIDNVDVVAVVDPIEPARQTYADEYGIPRGYATLAEALENENPDLVSVCVWHLLHDPITVEAAQWPSVKGIICEKPMAIGMQRADRMVDACAATDTKLVISHQRRFTPGWVKAKELVEDGAIGEVLRADLRVRDGLANWGTHSIDGARFVTGDPKAKWVMGAAKTPAWG